MGIYVGILIQEIWCIYVSIKCTGDSRICLANITWISPDTTTWIRNPQNSQKGELALDVVVEKSAIKQSGDAWRIVLDSCLPVFHLIDTRRSIPYGIKQIQELLGICCAFDQAVQVIFLNYCNVYSLSKFHLSSVEIITFL